MKIRTPLYPFFFAIYPIVFLYANNLGEISANKIIFPIILSLIIVTFLYLILEFYIRNCVKSSLILVSLIIGFFTYGYLFEFISESKIFSSPHLCTILLMLLFIGFFSFFILFSKKKKGLKLINNSLNIIAIVLIIFNATSIGFYHLKNMISPKKLEASVIQIESNDFENKDPNISNETPAIKEEKKLPPDIYYIILDEYASLNTIKKIWNFDNSEFSNFLKDKGFYVLENSIGSFSDTFYALVSNLNMEKLKDFSNREQLRQAYKNNKVFFNLREKGYKIVIFNNASMNDSINMKADVNYMFTNSVVDVLGDFDEILLANTLAESFENEFDTETENDYFKKLTLFILSKLVDAIELPGPKLVFAHIGCPHAPFVFGRNGEKIDNSEAFNWNDRNFYLDQYIFITKEVKILVEKILKASKTTPIIIIQSDHGTRNSHTNRKGKRFAVDYIPKDEYLNIFNAQLLPGMPKELLKDDAKAVDTFRLIFEYYFNDKFITSKE